MERDKFLKGAGSGFFMLLETLTPPLATVLCLIVVETVLRGNFDAPYVILAFLSALLVTVGISSNAAKVHAADKDILSFVGRIVFSWVFIVAIILIIGFATGYLEAFSRPVLLAWFVLTPIAIIGSLSFVRMLTLRHLFRSAKARPAVIVGINESSKKLARIIASSPELGMTLKGFFDDRKNGRTGTLEHPIIGGLEDVEAFVSKHPSVIVFNALPMRNIERVLNVMQRLQDTTACVYFVPDIFVFDLVKSNVVDINGVPAISMFEMPYHGRSYLAKRTLDLFGASAALVLLSPLMLAIAIAVKLSSPGPVLFKQRRYGMDGKEIRVWKFRTMTVMEDGDVIAQARKDDDRTTRIGRYLRHYSLDELPQLFNVLAGDMSLVGPRPHAVAHNEQYRKLIQGYMIRHKAIPGITGLAQVNGFRGETAQLEAMEGRVRYDLEYLRRWSVALDIKILLRTTTAIFGNKKAY